MRDSQDRVLGVVVTIERVLTDAMASMPERERIMLLDELERVCEDHRLGILGHEPPESKPGKVRVTARATLADDVDIRDVDEIELRIEHRYGEGGLVVERDDAGTWCVHESRITLVDPAS
jgi:hypothetical protein